MSVITNDSGATGAASDQRQDLERLRDLIATLPEPRAWPALVLLVGPPGSGKTTLARAIHERMPVVVIDADEIRRSLFDVPDYSFRESQRVDRAIRALIGELLAARRTVILDDSNLTEWERQPLYTLAERHHARLVIVEVTAPSRVVLDRIRHVAVHTPQDTAQLESLYSRLAGRQEPISRPHLTVDTSHDITQVVEGIVLDLEEG